MNKIKREDITYNYGYFGYMIKYKGKNIGGAGTKEKGKKTQANLKYNKDMAELEMRNIMEGIISTYMAESIRKIEEEESVRNK